MPEPVDPHHLLLIGAGPGVGAGVVRRFGREGFRTIMLQSLLQLANFRLVELVGIGAPTRARDDG